MATRITGRPVRGDGGQATLEYVGSLFVVVLLIGSVLLGATPVGQAIAAKICEAFGATCGVAGQQQDRQELLGIKCTVSNRENTAGVNGSYEVKVSNTSKGAQALYGDGSSRVTVSNNLQAGVDVLSTGVGKAGSFKLSATGGDELGYVYNFPPELGGQEAASKFFDDRRDPLHQVVGAVSPGAQSVEEGAERIADATGNWLGDHVLGRSAEQKAQAKREQQAKQADAVQIATSLEGQAGLSAGAGVTKKTGQGPDATKETIKGPLSGQGDAKLTLKGMTTIPTHTDGPDAMSPTFTAELGGTASGSGSAGGDGSALPPFFNVGGTAGAKGSYTVTYDQNGQPTRLAVTDELTYGGTKAINPKTYESANKSKGELKQSYKGNHVSVTTRTLDLDTSTPEGRANRAAFDQVFTPMRVGAGDYHANASVPKALIPGLEPNPVEVGRDYAQLAERLNADAFVMSSDYDETGQDTSGDIKVLGIGGGVAYGNTDRQLMDATAHDNRTGADVELADCG